MKAPDKICVAPHQIFDYDLDIQEVGHNGAEEYIRKDALLEWLRKTEDEALNEVPMLDVLTLQKVIDKLNKM